MRDHDQIETKHLTPSELAARWGFHVGTLANHRSDGTGPDYLKFGGRVAYRIIDVESYEDGLLIKAGAS